MDDENVISNEESVVDDSVLSGSDSISLDSDIDPVVSISNEEIIEALKIIVNDNVQNVSDNASPVEDFTPVEPIDYTEKLISIDTELANIRELLQTKQVSEALTIFEKPINEYTVEESIGTLGVVIVICALVVAFVKYFTFNLWK